jgi:hypothetical protein
MARRRRNKKKPVGRDYRTQQVTDFITPEQVPTANVDAKAMFGEMPTASECILMGDVLKVNHQCQWTHRCLALTSEMLCFSFNDKDAIRDKILLNEVRKKMQVCSRPVVVCV